MELCYLRNRSILLGKNPTIFYSFTCVQFCSVQSLSRVQLFVTPWIAAHQASLSITNSRSSLRLMSIESVMPSSHLILCRPLLLLPPIPPSIRVFSNKSTLCMTWPKYWSFSFTYIHMYSLDFWLFCRFSSHLGDHRAWSRVPCAVQ